MDMDVVDTKTNTKCFKDPMYAIFLKISGFKDFKYDMDMDIVDIDKQGLGPKGSSVDNIL